MNHRQKGTLCITERLSSNPERLLHVLLVSCVATAFLLILAGCSSPAAGPAGPQSSAIGVRIEVQDLTQPAFRGSSYKYYRSADALYFARLDVPDSELIRSSLSSEGYVYLMNVTEGRYAPVLASFVYTTQTASGQPAISEAFTFLPRELIDAATVRVSPGRFYYLGVYRTDTEVGMKHADAWQKRFHTEHNKRAKRRFTGDLDDEALGYLIKPYRGTSVKQTGKPGESDVFYIKTKKVMANTGWVRLINQEIGLAVSSPEKEKLTQESTRKPEGTSGAFPGINEQSLLLQAVNSGDIEKTKKALDLVGGLSDRGGEFETPLHIAARRGFTEIAKLLIDKGADLNAVDMYKQTPLYLAARTNREEIARYLILKNASVNPVRKGWSEPLAGAAIGGNIKIARLMIARGAKVNSDTGSYLNRVKELSRGFYYNQSLSSPVMPITLATANGHFDMMKFLISKGARIHKSTKKAMTRLVMDATESNDLQKVAYLVSLGARLDYDENIKTPLHVAILKGYNKLGGYLVLKGANINAIDRNGETPLDWAIDAENTNMVRFLRSRKARRKDKATSNRQAGREQPVKIQSQQKIITCTSKLRAPGGQTREFRVRIDRINGRLLYGYLDEKLERKNIKQEEYRISYPPGFFNSPEAMANGFFDLNYGERLLMQLHGATRHPQFSPYTDVEIDLGRVSKVRIYDFMKDSKRNRFGGTTLVELFDAGNKRVSRIFRSLMFNYCR